MKNQTDRLEKVANVDLRQQIARLKKKVGISSLVDLDDVNINSPTDGQVLTFNSENNKWGNETAPGGGEGGTIVKANLLAGDGITVTGGTNKILDNNATVENTDRGSVALAGHISEYDHDLFLSSVAADMPLSGTGLSDSHLVLNYGTSLKKDGNNKLDTIQDIRATASPTHAGLTLTNFNGFVRADSGVLSARNLLAADIPALSYEPPITAAEITKYWRGDKTFQLLNQAAVAGLTVSDSVVHAGLRLTNFNANGFVKNDNSGVLSGGNKLSKLDMNDLVEREICFGNATGQIAQSENLFFVNDILTTLHENIWGNLKLYGDSITDIHTDETYGEEGIFEKYDTEANVDGSYRKNFCDGLGQTFIAGSAHTVTGAWFKVWRTASDITGEITCTLYEIVYSQDGTSIISHTELGVATALIDTATVAPNFAGTWIYFTFETPVELVNGARYAIDACPSYDYGGLACDTSGSPYAGGDAFYFSGTSWVVLTGADCMFKIVGKEIFAEVITQGCLLYTKDNLVCSDDDLRWDDEDLILTINGDIATSTETGMKIGTAGGANGQKLGFWNKTPIVQPVLATGASRTVDEVITVLQNLGLVRQT